MLQSLRWTTWLSLVIVILASISMSFSLHVNSLTTHVNSVVSTRIYSYPIFQSYNKPYIYHSNHIKTQLSRTRYFATLPSAVNDKVEKATMEKSSPSLSSVKYSGSSGAAIDIMNVAISIGNNDILSNVVWSILPNERWAIVGRNGEGNDHHKSFLIYFLLRSYHFVGKSTLLKAITETGGETLSISSGEICIAKQSRIGFLEQKGVSGSKLSVRDEVTSRMDRLMSATKTLEFAEAAVGQGDTSDDMLTLLTEATIEFEAAGGYDIEKKISNVLKGLGL